jgi:hypothetical protein
MTLTAELRLRVEFGVGGIVVRRDRVVERAELERAAV